MSIATTNPTTGEVLKRYPYYSATEIESRVAVAWNAYEAICGREDLGRKERIECLKRTADLLIERKDEYSRLMVTEMGKPLTAAVQELEKCAATFLHYAAVGADYLTEHPVTLPADKKLDAGVRHLPVGIVLAIMPWNFPFWQVLRCAAPILLGGNSMILKHASNVPGCALAIEKLFKDAGLEDGAFQTLLIGSDAIPSLIADNRIQGVTLTGSEPAGRDVASHAGQAIKKTVLELGGSDPFVVMPSADIKKAVETAVKARLINNGQSCVAAKRFIVHEKIYDSFRDQFVEKMNAIKPSDPMVQTTTLGPLVSLEARTLLHAQVQDAVKAGAKLLTGGMIPPGVGAFYPPTVIEAIPRNAHLRQEEAFGPVASLYRVSNIKEAIELANETRFGLGASFWSSDAGEIEKATREIRSGTVAVNAMVSSDPHLPFGGVKSSGYGRELGVQGLYEFTNVKTVMRAQ